MTKAYYEAYPVPAGYRWKIYQYDSTGDNEILIYRSDEVYDTPEQAVDACVEFMDDQDIDAELA